MQCSTPTIDSNTSIGTVVAVRGSVVDARFSHPLPPLGTELHTGRDDGIVVEVLAQLDHETIRGIALTSTRGLSRGSTIVNTQHPLRVPVGQELLGRMLNVFGQPIDHQPLDTLPLRSLHAKSPALADRHSGRRHL